MTSQEALQKRLESHLQLPCQIQINENRSTMLHLLERNRHRFRLSIHKMFLEAPDNVIAAVANYLQGKVKQRKESNQQIRHFINVNLDRFDHSHLINQKKLSTLGKFYDLRELFDELNCDYFGNSLNLHLTWFGHQRPRGRFRITFGEYVTNLKLVKIHQRLDDPFFPRFFVSFIVYHEMLHAHLGIKVNEKGRCQMHGKDFKALEKKFLYYQEAIDWEEANKHTFFRR